MKDKTKEMPIEIPVDTPIGGALSRDELLAAFYTEYLDIFSCEEVVCGSGNLESGILLIGEAPGREEVKLSKPFVGAAGKQLQEFLELMGMQRDSIYITNAIKYRLSRINEKTGRVSNRPARSDEIISNRQYLLREIDIIRPACIVTLGNVPLRSVTGNIKANIGGLHGEIMSTEILNNKYRLFPLYHPASIIYNRSLKDVYVYDILKLKGILTNS